MRSRNVTSSLTICLTGVFLSSAILLSLTTPLLMPSSIFAISNPCPSVFGGGGGGFDGVPGFFPMKRFGASPGGGGGGGAPPAPGGGGGGGGIAPPAPGGGGGGGGGGIFVDGGGGGGGGGGCEAAASFCTELSSGVLIGTLM